MLTPPSEKCRLLWNRLRNLVKSAGLPSVELSHPFEVPSARCRAIARVVAKLASTEFAERQHPLRSPRSLRVCRILRPRALAFPCPRSLATLLIGALLALAAPASGEFIDYAYRGKWDGSHFIICGTVMNGSGTTPIVARVLGPSLAPYTSAPRLANPNVKEKIAGQAWNRFNNRWGDQDNNGSIDSPSLRAAFLARVAQAGMVDFASASSNDCALAFDSGPVIRMFRVEAAGAAQPGEFHWEWANADPSTAVNAVNLSVRRKFINGNRDRLSFTLAEGPSRQVIITARGPSLSGLIGSLPYLTDPVIALHHGDQRLAYNDNWYAQTEPGVTGQDIANAISSSGLPSFTSTGSKDAAILATLPPGTYTVSLWGGLLGPQTDGEVVLSVTLVP